MFSYQISRIAREASLCDIQRCTDLKKRVVKKHRGEIKEKEIQRKKDRERKTEKKDREKRQRKKDREKRQKKKDREIEKKKTERKKNRGR